MNRPILAILLLVLGGLGLAALLAANPIAFEAIRWAGVGYLLFFKTGEEKHFHNLKLKDTVRGMSVHPDGLRVATTHYDGHIRTSKMTEKAA